MKPNATKSENCDFFTFCSINMNLASISGTGNIQTVFILDPCVMKDVWCDIVDSSRNYFSVSLLYHVLVSCIPDP